MGQPTKWNHDHKDDIGKIVLLFMSKFNCDLVLKTDRFHDADYISKLGYLQMGTVIDVRIKERRKPGSGSKRFRVIHDVMINKSKIVQVEHVDRCFILRKKPNKNFVIVKMNGKLCNCFDRSYL